MTEAAPTAEVFAALFPHPVAAVAVDIGTDTFALQPEEAVAVAKAVPSRRAEFAAGRHCARQAMISLGLTPQAIVQGADRAPVWPEGVIGSISHSAGQCVAVVARQGPLSSIGIDMEPVGAVTQDLARMILRPEEAAAWPAEAPWGADPLTLHFCLKEAAYKALYPLCRRFVDFLDMSIEIAPAGGGFRATPLIAPPPKIELAGRYRVARGRIHAACWVTSTP